MQNEPISIQCYDNFNKVPSNVTYTAIQMIIYIEFQCVISPLQMLTSYCSWTMFNLLIVWLVGSRRLVFTHQPSSMLHHFHHFTPFSGSDELMSVLKMAKIVCRSMKRVRLANAKRRVYWRKQQIIFNIALVCAAHCWLQTRWSKYAQVCHHKRGIHLTLDEMFRALWKSMFDSVWVCMWVRAGQRWLDVYFMSFFLVYFMHNRDRGCLHLSWSLFQLTIKIEEWKNNVRIHTKRLEHGKCVSDDAEIVSR